MREALLTLVYYVVFVPLWVLAKVVRDPLHREWDPRRTTYWTFTDRAPVVTPPGAGDATQPKAS